MSANTSADINADINADSGAILHSPVLQVPEDPMDLLQRSLDEKWGDGLPLIPPTDERVLAMLQGTPRAATEVIATVPPRRGAATVELVAINAVMAGCLPRHLPLLIAALEAIAKPAYNGFGLAATTSPVASMMIVNGPLRDAMEINYRAGCLGGATGRGSTTLGRALQLCLRNIGGMVAGETSRTVFGQPGRVSGACFGEWEERSEWPSLAMRRGYQREQEVVTVHGAKGTAAVINMTTARAEDLAYLLAKSAASPMGNLYVGPLWPGETVLLINPMWAEKLFKVFPRVESFQEFVHENAWQAIDYWPEQHQQNFRDNERVDSRGRVHAMAGPEKVQPVICGGLGNLHGTILPSWGKSEMQSSATVRAA